jgi:hypothetical protein
VAGCYQFRRPHFQGREPADLPARAPTKYELEINEEALSLSHRHDSPRTKRGETKGNETDDTAYAARPRREHRVAPPHAPVAAGAQRRFCARPRESSDCNDPGRCPRYFERGRARPGLAQMRADVAMRIAVQQCARRLQRSAMVKALLSSLRLAGCPRQEFVVPWEQRLSCRLRVQSRREVSQDHRSVARRKRS